MSTVTLDFSKAQPLPQPVTLDFSNAQPISSVPDITANPKGQGTYKMIGPKGPVQIPYSNVAAAKDQGLRFASADDLGRYDKDSGASLLQRAKNNFNFNTQGAQPGDSGVKGFVENIGQGGGQTISAIAHPINTVESMAHMVAHPVDEAHAEVNALRADPSRFIGNAVGQVGTGAIAGEAAAPAVNAMADAAKPAIGDAATAVSQYVRPKSSPSVVPPEELLAQKIAQTILPPGGIKPELVKSIQAQAPAIVEYANRTGNPLNTQAEGLKAAQGVAKEGLEHYQNEVLGPVANRSVVLDPQSTELGSKATIGDIDTRIAKLNRLINTDKAASGGAALDVLAKSKWTDEVSYLRDKLYSSLEQTTGIPKQDLQTLREGYGGEFSLSNQLEAAQNARLTRVGEQSQGKTNINIRRPSILEAPGMAYNALKGGEQAIADRQFSSAIKQVAPQAPARPVPPPIDTDAVAAQQQAAQQEFLRQHQLQQAAQESAAGRSQAVQTYRDEQATNNRAAAQIEAVRTTQLQQAAQDSSAGRSQQVSSARQAWIDKGAANISAHSPAITPEMTAKLAQSAEGRDLLTKASSVSPKSSMMNVFVQKANELLGN